MFGPIHGKQQQIKQNWLNCNQTEFFKVMIEQCHSEEDKCFSDEKHSRVVSRTSTQHVSVIWKAVITLQEKL